MNLKTILASNARALDKEEINILTGQRRQIQKISSNLTPVFDEFIKVNKGGKKIRGFLVKLGYELASNHLRGVRQVKAQSHLGGEISQVAAAYEILHTSILAHDDVIDKSPTRRGIPSLYKSVGVEQAITLADYGFFLAMKIISESKFKQNLKIKALNLFSQTMVETAIGQMLDIQHVDPFTIMKLKTAKYTIAGPLQLGATFGGADERLLGYLGLFGENLGIAFQIRDDILDGEVESVEKAKVQALEYTDKARVLIPKLTGDAKMRKLLQDLVDYLVERRN